MKIRTLFYTLWQGVRNIFRNAWFSLASIATIAICLFLFGLFFAIVSNFQHIVKTAEEGVSVTIYFEEGTTEERMKEIGELIRARNEVAKADFFSAEEVWAEFSEQMNFGEYAEGFPDNPLANSANYEIYLNDVAQQADLVTYLESLPEIRRINRSEIAASTLTEVNMLIGYVSAGIIIVLLGVSVFLISNTVTIGISVRQEEITIMKYIGATDFFVRAPFVIEGMLIGLVGAAIPLAAIHLLYNEAINYIIEQFPTLANLMNFLSAEAVFTILTPLSLGVGVGIGFLGSYGSVRRHLHV